MAVNYVKFQRGSQAAYDRLVELNRVEDNTLYFIYTGDNDGKLYLGDRLISGNSNTSSLSLAQLTDVLVNEIKENSFLVQNAEGKWYNKSLSDVVDLIKSQTIINDITGINEKYFTISEAKKLGFNFFKDVDENTFSITDINDSNGIVRPKVLQLKSVPAAALTPVLGDLSKVPLVILEEGTESNLIVDNINNIYNILTWGDMT